MSINFKLIESACQFTILDCNFATHIMENFPVNLRQCFTVSFSPHLCFFWDKSGGKLSTGCNRRGMHSLSATTPPPRDVAASRRPLAPLGKAVHRCIRMGSRRRRGRVGRGSSPRSVRLLAKETRLCCTGGKKMSDVFSVMTCIRKEVCGRCRRSAGIGFIAIPHPARPAPPRTAAPPRGESQCSL